MAYVKSVSGFVVHTLFTISEGEYAFVEDAKVDMTIKRLLERGVLVKFDTMEELEAHTFTPSHVLAAQSLASLNPPVDREGNLVPVPDPTYDFEKNVPIKQEPAKVETPDEKTPEVKTPAPEDLKK